MLESNDSEPAEKSALQLRAEEAYQRFVATGRKPVVIEFAGVPKAGKTSILSQLQAFLKRCGFRVTVVVERASVCPIRDKKHANFNVWTACTTLAQVLETTQTPPRSDDPDVLILDRGLFDSVCWLTMMERLSRLRQIDCETIERFLTIDDWRKRITAVIVMIASPADSMEREKGHLPVVGAYGSIMNEKVLQQMLDTTAATAERLKNKFSIFIVDTSAAEFRNKAARTSEQVADIVLTKIEEHLQEAVLNVPKALVRTLMSGRTSLGASDAAAVIDTIGCNGKFTPRATVEKDQSVLQPLPVVVVRNKSGDVLRLRRCENRQDNPLHGKIVVWAGGHVREEDGTPVSSLLPCAVRELQEELRLSVEETQLRLLGAVYADPGNKTSQHMALVYEWVADTDDVALVLSPAEFFERQGTSLSGSFVSLEALARDVEAGKIKEVWSTEIVQNLLPKTAVNFKQRLI